MKRRVCRWGATLGIALALPAPAPRAQLRDLAEVREAVERSGTESVEALERALGLVADAGTRRLLERARTEVLEIRDRALADLDRADRGLLPLEEGLAAALRAIERYPAILRRVVAEAPVETRAVLRNALRISPHAEPGSP